MNNSGLFYAEPVFRPPSEGKRSLLLTVTIGCAYNCTFCYPYRKKNFTIRKFDEIERDIILARKIYGEQVSRIFLLDGNAFIAKPDLLIKVSEACYKYHPNLERISAYAHAKDILRKSEEDLLRIQSAGLTMVYLGIETGDDDLLKKINKNVTSKEIIEACHKLYKANITLSATIILGLAGNEKKKSDYHAQKTAELINQLNPPQNLYPNREWYISALTLMTPPTTPIEEAVRVGNFIPITPKNALLELHTLISYIDTSIEHCIFRSNHASNYLPIKGILGKDRKKILHQIESMMNHPEHLRSEFFRGL